MSESHPSPGPSPVEAPGILAVIPAYNESRKVADIASRARAYLPVLVVDDGSNDDTAARAASAGAVVLQQNPNQGKGAALTAGFAWALQHGYAAVLTLDADGQHDPAEIPHFLSAWAAVGLDLLIGQRDFSQMPPVRRASNTLGTWLFSWAVGRPVPDNQSGYRLISRRLVEILCCIRERGFEFEVEMIVSCIAAGYQMGWVPIRTIYAGERSHIHPLRHVYKFIQVSLRAHRVLRMASASSHLR